MDCESLLRENSQSIATRAAEASSIAQGQEVLEALVLAAAHAAGQQSALDQGILARVAGLNGAGQVAVRAVETACLDCLYGRGDDEAVRDFALRLRACFHAAHPRPTPNPDAKFFSAWHAPEAGEPPASDAPLQRCLSTILANLVEMVYVHDEDGVLLFANRRCEEVTGYSVEELLSPMTVFDFLPPEYQQLVEDRLATLSPGAQSPFSLEILNKWGQRVPLEFSLQHLPLTLAPGESREFVLVCAHDCHLSRNLERQLASVRDFEQRVLNDLPLGLIVTNEDLIVVEANAPALMGAGVARRSELVGTPIYRLLEPEDPALRAKLQHVLASDEEWRTEYFGKTHAGHEIRCELTAVPLHDHAMQPCGLILLLRDIAVETNHNQQRVQAQKLQALGTTIAGVSHELNNPLTGIVGYTQLLLASDIPPSIRTRVDHIAMEARRAQRIVQNLLTFAQRHETRKALHDVNQVVQNVLSLQEYQLRVDGITVTSSLSESLPPTLIDMNALQTVFLHIVNNAHQALIESGKAERYLAVSTYVENDLINIAFADTGPGLSSALQARIFDPFFTTRQPGAGPGLGLSVSYGIVQDHGGQILLTSEEGIGSTFTIVLPIREEVPEDHQLRH